MGLSGSGAKLNGLGSTAAAAAAGPVLSFGSSTGKAGASFSSFTSFASAPTGGGGWGTPAKKAGGGGTAAGTDSGGKKDDGEVRRPFRRNLFFRGGSGGSCMRRWCGNGPRPSCIGATTAVPVSCLHMTCSTIGRLRRVGDVRCLTY